MGPRCWGGSLGQSYSFSNKNNLFKMLNVFLIFVRVKILEVKVNAWACVSILFVSTVLLLVYSTKGSRKLKHLLGAFKMLIPGACAAVK